MGVRLPFTAPDGTNYRVIDGDPMNSYYLQVQEGEWRTVEFHDERHWKAMGDALCALVRLAVPDDPSLKEVP